MRAGPCATLKVAMPILTCDVAIIGAGSAGLSARSAAAKEGARTLLIEGGERLRVVGPPRPFGAGRQLVPIGAAPAPP